MVGMQAIYQTLIQQIVDESVHDENILGILLIGSVARGDALPGADLDMRLILAPGTTRKVEPELRKGILIERGYTDVTLAQAKLDKNPLGLYAYLDGRILFDPQGLFAQLKEQARERFETFQYTQQERDGIAYWLQIARLKMKVALTARDQFKASFVAITTSWEILMGLWAVNSKPMPPNSSAWFHLKDLSLKPPDSEEMLTRLFTGETQMRVQATIDMIDWILPHLGVQ